MTNPIKTAADAVDLFECRGQERQGGQVYNKETRRFEYGNVYEPATKLLTESGIEHYKKWYPDHFKIEEVKPMGKLWPEGVEVEQTFYSYRNCYAQAKYVVRSPRELTEADFAILRVQGAFMGGQATGVTGAGKQTAEGWEYPAYSECDSGD